MIILRLGLTSLIAGALLDDSIIYEPGIKKNSSAHQALLRLRTNKITEMLDIPTKEVTVYKSIWLDGKEVQPSTRTLSLYSRKVSGRIESRSILDISTQKRYIPPKNLYQILINKNEIKYGVNDFMWHEIKKLAAKDTIISTLHMDKMAVGSGADDNFINQLNSSGIFVNKFLIKNCDFYATVYYPELDTPIYRASLNGNELIVESIDKPNFEGINYILKPFGFNSRQISEKILENHYQPYGKITEVDDDKRRQFITKLTLEHNIYSLGRFATWRPKLMLDDVIDDVAVIKRLMRGGASETMNYYRR